MNKTIIIAIACLVAGFGFGYTLPKQSSLNSDFASDKQVEPTESSDNRELTASKEEVEVLQSKVVQLEKELAASVASVDEEEIFQRKQKEWVDTILQRLTQNIHYGSSDKLAKKLGLTPEQQIEADRLGEKLKIARRIMTLQSIGVLTKEEVESMYPEYIDFNFNEQLDLFLTDEQKLIKKKNDQKQKIQGSEMITLSMMQRYDLRDSDKFTSEESDSIQSAIKTAFNGPQKLEIPEAIEKLEVSTSEKRILTKCYQNLDQELFEKVYASMIEKKGE